MTNMQLYLSIGLPTFTSLLTLIIVVLGWFLSRSDNNRLSDKMDTVAARLDAKMDAIASGLNARMDAMNKAHHDDNKSLLEAMVPLHERMARLEGGR